jgi:hypothetical protein
MDDSDDEDNGKGRSKSRRELPAGAVATLKAWLVSPEHFTHPYPTPQDQVMLMQKTGIDKKQLKNWFTNARRRIWKPMLKKQLEQGKVASSGVGVVMAMPGVVPGVLPAPGMDPQQSHYRHPGHVQHQELQQQVRDDRASLSSFLVVQETDTHSGPLILMHSQMVDQYGNPIYAQPTAPPPPQYYDQGIVAPAPMPLTSSIGALGALANSGSSTQMSKNDSHAVLMELFARDQDLVRQATESATLKRPADSTQAPPGHSFSHSSEPSHPISSQHPISSSKQKLVNVPTLNSWPHFSSVSSLNNLGTMPGVKSITSLSGADLARQGAVNSLGNLAQIKSLESMGKNDSYAFLEVFFGDRSSNNLSQMSKDGQRGIKREREDDGDVGLSLDDESPAPNARRDSSGGSHQTPEMIAGPFMSEVESPGSLKQAFDAAVAARGLMSVSRSSEKLTDLALPAKIQRTLSQEFMRKQQEQQHYPQYQYSASPAPAPTLADTWPKENSQQYPGQHPGQHQNQSGQSSYSTETSDANNSVEVPSATKCAICHQTNVDTQLRPCGHMFHERCLKPSLQSPLGPPTCPVDNIAMQSALLRLPVMKPVAGSITSPVPTGRPMMEYVMTCFSGSRNHLEAWMKAG